MDTEIEATTTEPTAPPPGLVPIGEAVQTIDIIAPDGAFPYRTSATRGTVISHATSGPLTHVVRHVNGKIAGYRFEELTVVELPLVEVKRFCLFAVDVPWPDGDARAFDVAVRAPAELRLVQPWIGRSKDGPPQPMLRFVFNGSPDAPEVTKKFMFSPIGEVLNFRVDKKTSAWPVLAEVVTSPLTGEALGIWTDVDDVEVEIPSAMVKQDVRAADAPT
jgi:hypothetical protein